MSAPPDYTTWATEETARGLVYVSPDGTQAYSPVRNRTYTRMFNHATARALRAAGLSLNDIAARLGVTNQAIMLATAGRDYQIRYADRANAYQMRGVCELCGGRTVQGRYRHATDGRLLCKTCRDGVRREGIRYDVDGIMVRCITCKQFFPGDAFTGGSRYRDVRDQGYGHSCRTCGTAARTAYRARHQVPCEGGCGTLVEGRGRATRAGQDPNRPFLCRHCYYVHRRRTRANAA